MPKAPGHDPSPSDRTKSHAQASPSPRCGFGWVKEVLRGRLEAWNAEDAQDCERIDIWAHKYFTIAREALPHIVGKGGKMIQAIEDFCGVFFTVHDVDTCEAQILVSGPRSACVLAEFVCEMIAARHFSVLATFLRHGF